MIRTNASKSSNHEKSRVPSHGITIPYRTTAFYRSSNISWHKFQSHKVGFLMSFGNNKDNGSKSATQARDMDRRSVEPGCARARFASQPHTCCTHDAHPPPIIIIVHSSCWPTQTLGISDPDLPRWRYFLKQRLSVLCFDIVLPLFSLPLLSAWKPQ